MKRLARVGRFVLGGLFVLGFELGLAASAHAGPLLADPYGTGVPDVLGDASLWDIRSLEVVSLAPGDLRIAIRMNFNGGDATLAGFSVPGGSFALAPLAIGDVLFEGRDFLWAIPLAGPSGGPGGPYFSAGLGPVPVGEATPRQVFPGGVYLVPSFMTAGEVLGVMPADDFRADAPVWGTIGTDLPVSFGYITSTVVGGSELEILVTNAVSAAFLDDLSDGYRVRFASTTCACDVLDVTVPEPAAGALVALTAALLLVRARLGARE
jgi:hypothetical protein